MDNGLSVPVSVVLSLDMENLEGSDTSQILAVIPERASGYVIGRYRKINAERPYKYNYTWKTVLGDVSKIGLSGYVYSFPFEKGNPCKVSQGPGGAFSHQDMFAYDFVMPIGTPVTAARDGLVAMVKTDSERGGPDRTFIDDANFISIYHEDGTIANYFHLKNNGALVKEGQYVKKGDIIGYSGNTGFTSGPHLHFEVIQPTLSTDKSVFVKFNWEAQTESLFANLYRKSRAIFEVGPAH